MKYPDKIAIGCDHAGFELKEAIKAHLAGRGVECEDFGAWSTDSVDYPEFAHAVSEAIEAHRADYGILICGTANGIAMAANKHRDIRAAIAWTESIARLAREHNNANIICLPARVVAVPLAVDCVDIFMTTDFQGGRHERRVEKISAC